MMVLTLFLHLFEVLSNVLLLMLPTKEQCSILLLSKSCCLKGTVHDTHYLLRALGAADSLRSPSVVAEGLQIFNTFFLSGTILSATKAIISVPSIQGFSFLISVSRKGTTFRHLFPRPVRFQVLRAPRASMLPLFRPSVSLLNYRSH
jgi:hypothetical protein